MYLVRGLTLTCLVCLLSCEKSFGREDEENVDRFRYCRQVPSHIYAEASKSGFITSPFYGERNVPENVRCYWDIHAPAGFRIKSTVLDLDLDPTGGGCSENFVDFYGRGASDWILTLCGSDIPFPILSRRGENILRISFQSDMYGSGRGFKLRYDVIPDEEDCPAGHVVCRNRNCIPDSRKCDGIDDCLDGTDEQGCGYPVRTTEECGQPFYKPKTTHDKSPDRIINGEEAVPHSWPWQAQICSSPLVEPCPNLCGGALINPQWILTATHCLGGNVNPNQYKIRLGVHDKLKKAEGEQIRYSERIIGYPDLEGRALKGFIEDIALIKLNAPVNFTKTVSPACLPSPGLVLPAETDCYTTGWGSTRGTGFSGRLKQALLTTVKYNCGRTILEICVKPRESYDFVCFGDSGGPLSCKLGEKWYLMGDLGSMTVAGPDICGLPGNFAFYASVSQKIDWIKKTVDKFS